MAEVAEKEIPKTIIVDVNNESYNKGWSDGYDVAEKHGVADTSLESQKYLGRTSQYWLSSFIELLPLILLIIFCLIFGNKSQKKADKTNSKILSNQEGAIARADLINEKILERNEKVIGELTRTNALLQQLIEKLDKQ